MVAAKCEIFLKQKNGRPFRQPFVLNSIS